MSGLAFDFSDVQSAADALRGVANRTPVFTSRTLDEAAGAQAFLKMESFQRTGSFKFRGAYNALSRLAPEERARGVLTFSSGNHAQAIALAARLLGISATVVMPADAPKSKIAATRGYGADVVFYDREKRSREDVAAEINAERRMAVIPPYDHPHVAAGQGTSAKELFEEVGALDVLLVAVGGGGLISGCATAAKALCPACRVVGVEPEMADDAARSFRTGTLHTVKNPPTIADGVRTPSLGAVTFPIVRARVDDIVTVAEEGIRAATRFAFERLRCVIEPTGALPIAPLLDGRLRGAGRVGVIVCGGNMDPEALGA